MKGVRSRITDGDVSSQSNVFVSCCLYVGHQFICVMLFVSRRPIYLCNVVCMSDTNLFVSCCLYVGHQFICVMLFVSRRPIYLCKFVCKSDTNLFVLTLLGFMANGDDRAYIY